MPKKIINIIFFYFLIFYFNLNSFVLKRVILSSDAKPEYLDFWPIVAKAWQEVIGVRPTLALIADKSVKVDETLGDVVRFDPMPDVPISTQAQVIRLILPAFFEDDICILSDIDMIPINKNYFIDRVKNVPDDKFVVYRSKGYGYYQKRFPMCYVAAKGKIFKEIFNIDLNNIPKTIRKWHSYGFGWSTDEEVMHRLVAKWHKKTKRALKLPFVRELHIQRGKWGYNKQALEKRVYVDAHFPKPYKDHKELIDNFLQELGYNFN